VMDELSAIFGICHNTLLWLRFRIEHNIIFWYNYKFESVYPKIKQWKSGSGSKRL